MRDRLLFHGAIYERVAVNHPLQRNQAESLSTELQVARAHLEEIVEDAEKVTRDARKLLHSLETGAQQIANSLKEDGEVHPNNVYLLSPEGRQEGYLQPLHSMEKANKMLNYTVDAATAAIKTSIEQVDAMVDDWEAVLDDMHAPNTSRELTAPMVMTDDSAANDVPTL